MEEQNAGGGKILPPCPQTDEEKKEARRNARLILSRISAAERKEASQKAADFFLRSSFYKEAECVAAYFSLPQEMDALPIIGRALADNKRVLLPRIIPNTNQMEFYALSAPCNFAGNFAAPFAKSAASFLETEPSSKNASPLFGIDGFCLEGVLAAQTEPNAWKIREPRPSLERVPKNRFPGRTAFLCPGLLFTKDGRRLGRGKGFYDRFLSELFLENEAFRLSGWVAGYCYAAQIVQDVPAKKSDFRMQAVVSDRGIIQPRPPVF